MSYCSFNDKFRKHKFTIRISNDSFQCLVKHLQVESFIVLDMITLFHNLCMVVYSDQSEHTHLEPHQPVPSSRWSVL